MVEKELLAITLELIEFELEITITVSITDLKLVDATKHFLVQLYFLQEQKQIDHLH